MNNPAGCSRRDSRGSTELFFVGWTLTIRRLRRRDSIGAGTKRKGAIKSIAPFVFQVVGLCCYWELIYGY